MLKNLSLSLFFVDRFQKLVPVVSQACFNPNFSRLTAWSSRKRTSCVLSKTRARSNSFRKRQILRWSVSEVTTKSGRTISSLPELLITRFSTWSKWELEIMSRLSEKISWFKILVFFLARRQKSRWARNRCCHLPEMRGKTSWNWKTDQKLTSRESETSSLTFSGEIQSIMSDELGSSFWCSLLFKKVKTCSFSRWKWPIFRHLKHSFGNMSTKDRLMDRFFIHEL